MTKLKLVLEAGLSWIYLHDVFKRDALFYIFGQYQLFCHLFYEVVLKVKPNVTRQYEQWVGGISTVSWCIPLEDLNVPVALIHQVLFEAQEPIKYDVVLVDIVLNSKMLYSLSTISCWQCRSSNKPHSPDINCLRNCTPDSWPNPLHYGNN